MIPKYRVWHHELGRLMSVKCMFFQDSEIEEFELNDALMNDYITAYPDEIELMQSTGLFDRNGKEIFEGDILDYRGRKALVRWHGSYASFIYRFVDEPHKQKAEWKPLYLAYMKCEIIGNIYENPEFLEDKK